VRRNAHRALAWEGHLKIPSVSNIAQIRRVHPGQLLLQRIFSTADLFRKSAETIICAGGLPEMVMLLLFLWHPCYITFSIFGAKDEDQREYLHDELQVVDMVRDKHYLSGCPILPRLPSPLAFIARGLAKVQRNLCALPLPEARGRHFGRLRLQAASLWKAMISVAAVVVDEQVETEGCLILPI
jgi:hypothetical protein